MIELIIVLWCAPIDSSFSIILNEKYGETKIINNVTSVIQKNDNFYITQPDGLYGVFPKYNYSIEKNILKKE